MRLPPGRRPLPPPRMTLPMLSATLKDRCGVAIPYASSHGWGSVSFVRNAALTYEP